ncbi:hypothetical protein EJB05_06960, partial [Eragrostis curvula]
LHARPITIHHVKRRRRRAGRRGEAAEKVEIKPRRGTDIHSSSPAPYLEIDQHLTPPPPSGSVHEIGRRGREETPPIPTASAAARGAVLGDGGQSGGRISNSKDHLRATFPSPWLLAGQMVTIDKCISCSLPRCYE